MGNKLIYPLAKNSSLIEHSNLLYTVTKRTGRNETFPEVLDLGRGRKPAKFRSWIFDKNPTSLESRPPCDHGVIIFEQIRRVLEVLCAVQVDGSK